MSERGEAGWLRRLAAYILVHRRDVNIAVGAAVLGSIGQSIVPLIARQIVDDVIGSTGARLWPWLVFLIVVALASFGLAYLRRYRGGRVALSVQYDLRNAMHDHLQTMDAESLAGMPTGQLVARANSDTALVQGLLGFLPFMGGNVLMLIVSLAIMLYLSPLLALVSVLMLPLLVLVSYRMRLVMFPASWDGQQREGDVAQIVDEDVNGVRIVKAFGQERRELERLAAMAGTLYGSRMRVIRLQSRFQPLLKGIPVLAQVAILGLGGWMAMHGSITIGTFLAFSTYVTHFVAPARMLAGLLTIGQQARAGAERIFALLDLHPAIVDPPDAIELPQVRGAIEFRDVSFGYGGDAHESPVLDGVGLRIDPGERVAFVGASGSGKSTLVSLVSRLYDPTRGSVLVDGHDVRAVTLHSLRRHIAVAFEESFLFSDTIGANIAYGRPAATRAEIEAAAAAARAHGFITDLPLGYETPVGERGLTLSGGQRQRIALARAILADPAILILDDATSAVDAATEEAIHDALRDVLAERTTLIVAHRLSSVRLADRVVVLEAGRIADTGTHEELRERSATYRALLTGVDDADPDADPDATDTAAVTAQAAGAHGGTESVPTRVSAAAWTAAAGSADGAAAGRRRDATAGLGGGLGGGGGSWQANLAPTPQLLARVAALPPVRDQARVDLDTESRRQRNFTLGTLLREFRRPLLLGLLLVVFDAAAGLAGPSLVKIGIDSGVRTGAATVLFAATAVYLVIALANVIDQVGLTFVTGGTAERAMLSLRVRIWAQLQRLSLDYYEHEMAGRIMTRMTTDVDQFEKLMENGLLNALVSIVTFFGVGAALLAVNLELGLFTLTVVIPLALATVWFRRRSRWLYDLSRERIAVANADFQESLAGVRESQTFVHESATSAQFHRLGERYLRSRVAAQRLVATYFPFVQFLAAVADVIVLGVGAHMIAAGELTPGGLIAFMLYITMFFSPIGQLSQVFDAWQQTQVSVGRIAQLMRVDPVVLDADHPEPIGRLCGGLELRDVHFAYPAATARPGAPAARRRGPDDTRLPIIDTTALRRPPEALRGIDLSIRPGETVALVGETGAGKSTIVKLLARFYDPGRGAVLADGVDLRELDLHVFRASLGYVPQEPFLFSGTVRDNIAYGRPAATDAEVEAAARAVGAHSFVAGLPGGYRHELGERGRSLSAGQRQLLALARAELVDPAILLLDEATSNLDLVTEARVGAAMRRLTGDRTSIVIAHRLQTARGADRIAVLDHGRIVELGSHDELLALDGRYASMWRAFDLAAVG